MDEPGSTPIRELDGSSNHTIEIHGIPEALLQRLDELARMTGSDRSQVIQAILARELSGENPQGSSIGFDKALESIRLGFAESNLSEEEVTLMLDEGLRATRQAKRLEHHNREATGAHRVLNK